MTLVWVATCSAVWLVFLPASLASSLPGAMSVLFVPAIVFRYFLVRHTLKVLIRLRGREA